MCCKRNKAQTGPEILRKHQVTVFANEGDTTRNALTVCREKLTENGWV